MINAMNHSDGLDGLAGGESLISLGALAFLFYLSGSESALIIALAVIGGIYGFMRYNTHPARVFMGDSGSQFLGFTLAFLVLVLTQWVDRDISPTVALLLLGLPIIDIIAVLIKRMRAGMSWFLATRNHFHHRLLDLGFVHRESVVIIYTVQTLSVTLGVLLRHHDGWIILTVYILLCVGLLMLIILAEKKGWQHDDQSSTEKLSLAYSHDYLSRFLVVLPRRFLSIGVSLYLVIMSFIVATVPRDFAVMSGLVIVLMTLDIFFGHGPRSIMHRALIYIIVVSIIYLGVSFPPDIHINIQLLTTIFYTLLALAFTVAVKFSPRRRKIEFNTTPMDYLVIVVLIASLVASKGNIWGNDILLFIVGMIIILYACELLSTESREKWNSLSAGAMVSALVLSVRGFL
jgi:UDP-GlcNAc:undecaprenyl-phosphate GlcNAc-1-phosphate transferase